MLKLVRDIFNKTNEDDDLWNRFCFSNNTIYIIEYRNIHHTHIHVIIVW